MPLKASPDDQALLLELVALDTRLQQLDHRARMLPQHGVIVDLARQSDEVRLALAEQTGVREGLATELGRIESDVVVVEARITRDSERLQTSSSVKDVAALEQELVALRKRLDDLEEIELTVMERLEEHDSTLAETQSQAAALASATADAVAGRDTELAGIDGERATATATRRAIEDRLPAELVALYEKQRSRYGIGASHLRGGVSSASGVKLNSSDMQAVRAASPDDVLLCPDSNAILVRTAESGL